MISQFSRNFVVDSLHPDTLSERSGAICWRYESDEESYIRDMRLMNSDINLYVLLTVIALVATAVIIGIIRWKRGWRKRKGKMGERIVAQELTRLKRKETVVLNDILLPASEGRTSQIDHLVISTRGIFLIETKSHAGGITGSEHTQYWTQYLGGRKQRIYNPILQNRGHIRSLQRLLPEVDKSLFNSVIVFTEATTIKVSADDIIIRRRILPDRHIRRTFIPSERRKRHWWCPWREVRLDEGNVVVGIAELIAEMQRRRKVLDREEVERLGEMIRQKSLRGGSAVRAHTAYAKATAKRTERDIRQGNCPRCGAALVMNYTDRGEFLRCSNYPACRFWCSIKE